MGWRVISSGKRFLVDYDDDLSAISYKVEVYDGSNSTSFSSTVEINITDGNGYLHYVLDISDKDGMHEAIDFVNNIINTFTDIKKNIEEKCCVGC